MSLQCFPSNFGSIKFTVKEETLSEENKISERKDFSNSESLCHSDASHQVSAQSDTVWEEMSSEEIQDGCHGGHLGIRNRMILAILNLYVALMPPTKFRLNLTYFGGDHLKNFSHLGYRNGTILAILNLCVTVMPPIKVLLNPTYVLRGNVI